MAERGVAGCTTKEIAKAAGVAEGTIYNQFRDKSDLYLSVAAAIMPEFLRRLEDAPGRRDPRTLLVKVGNDTLKAMTELIPLFSGMIAEPELRAGVRERWRSQRAEGKPYGGLTEYLRAEQADGTIGDGVEANVLARMFVGTIFHHVFMRLLINEPSLEPTGRKFVESVVDAVLAAAGPARVKAGVR
jgi:AcrR family transcriptional regulator